MSESNMSSIQAKDDITIELSTRSAVRLFTGREKTDKRHGIMGIPGFCKLLKGIESAIVQDDPYADYFYKVIDDAIEELSFDLDLQLKELLEFIETNTPSAMNIPDSINSNPVVMPIKFASKMSFKMVYQLLKADKIILNVLRANHVGMLSNDEKFETVAFTERKVRSVIHKIFSYKYTGVTRDDLACNNQKAIQAIKAMGELEASYLEGSERSSLAPSLPKRRIQLLKKSSKDSLEVSLDGAIDELLNEGKELDKLAV